MIAGETTMTRILAVALAAFMLSPAAARAGMLCATITPQR